MPVRFLLLLAGALTLAACTVRVEAPPTAAPTATPTETVQTPDPETDATATAEPSPTPTATPEPTVTATPASTPTAAPIAKCTDEHSYDEVSFTGTFPGSDLAALVLALVEPNYDESEATRGAYWLLLHHRLTPERYVARGETCLDYQVEPLDTLTTRLTEEQARSFVTGFSEGAGIRVPVVQYDASGCAGEGSGCYRGGPLPTITIVEPTLATVLHELTHHILAEAGSRDVKHDAIFLSAYVQLLDLVDSATLDAFDHEGVCPLLEMLDLMDGEPTAYAGAIDSVGGICERYWSR